MSGNVVPSQTASRHMSAVNTPFSVVARRLMHYLRPHWLLIAAAIVPASIYAVINSFVPQLMSEVIKALGDPRAAANAWWVPLGFVVLFPIRSAMDVLTIFGLAWVGRGRNDTSNLIAIYS